MCVIKPVIYRLLRGEVCYFSNQVWEVLTNQDAALRADGFCFIKFIQIFNRQNKLRYKI